MTDPNGGVVASAGIKVVQLATNVAMQALSNNDGNFSLNELPRGEYLELGNVAESVEVTADASALETVDSVLGKVVDNRRITELPLNTRNVFSLLYLTPRVTGGVSTTYGTGYAINGARNSMLDILVDGVSTAHPTVNGFSGNSTFPPVEAIAEFKVLGSNYSAEFGRSNGGIVNVVYRSGTNTLHGSVFRTAPIFW